MANDRVQEALKKDDAFLLAQNATKEELDLLAAAENVLEKRRQRTHRWYRLVILGQAIAAYVALAGFFANAYQNWSDKHETRARAEQEQSRWTAEFKRASRTDRYNAFFQTSSLITDPNHDKHVVGYSLLKEFVDDPDYKGKTMTLLETSLSQELRSNTAKVGMDQAHRVAITEIVSALGHSSDCKGLQDSARSVDRLTFRQDRVGDAEETSEVFAMYVLNVLGAAASHCASVEDFEKVRQPLRDALVKIPAIGGSTEKLDSRKASRRLSEILRDECEDDMSISTQSVCPSALRGYAKLCASMQRDQPTEYANQKDACDLVTGVAASLTPTPVAASAPAK